MPRVREAVLQHSGVAQYRGDARSDRECRHRDVPGREAFGHRHHVRLDSVGHRSPAFSGSAEAADDFVRDQQHIVCAADFLQQGPRLAALVYDVVESFGGSISAEHGIGQAKREQLVRYRGETETGLMKAVKAALDPKNIMNPGKVI